jgi:uncharacterized protein
VRVAFIINTPGQAHTWKYIIKDLLARGNKVKIVARDYGGTLKILNASGLEYSSFNTFGSRFQRLMGSYKHIQCCYNILKDFVPSLVVGFGLDAAITAKRLKTHCIVFIDNESTYFQNTATKLTVDSIITPLEFKQDFGRKHIRIKSYKELAYLHPNRFSPDISILKYLQVSEGDPYVILRFNIFDAIHDIGKRGFTISEKYKLVDELQKYARVFISPEGHLPHDLKQYELSIPYHKIHDVLWYAKLVIADTGTLGTEAAILGTPTIICNPGVMRFSNFCELESKYGLINIFTNFDIANERVLKWIQEPNLKEQWVNKRNILLKDKMDFTQFVVDYIDNLLKKI